ncbi:hypothetical protein ACC785_37015, partial [Rhizobium ruizarguesonis]
GNASRRLASEFYVNAINVMRGASTVSEYKGLPEQDAVLEFVNSGDLRPLGALGTSCPDHFLRTKIRPLIVDFDPAKPDVDAIVAGLDKALEDYRA